MRGCSARLAPAAWPTTTRRTDLRTCCLARPALAARLSGDRRTGILPDLRLLRSAAAAWTDGWACRSAATSLGRPLRPGRAATDGRTTRPAAAVLGQPLRPGLRYNGQGLVTKLIPPALIQIYK
jgi:hypothetical protein